MQRVKKVVIRSTKIGLLVAGAFLALSGTTVKAEDQWVAIAVDGGGNWGYANGKPDRPSAMSGALAGCGAPECKLEFTERARCLAFVESRASGYWYGTGYGPTQAAVLAAARGGCSAGAPAGTCQVLKVVCN